MDTKRTADTANPINLQRYLALPDAMYAEVLPLQSKQPALLALNTGLLKEYGLDTQWFESGDGLDFLSGNHSYKQESPVAMAYSGHQFGYLSPLLGDGRAHLLGQFQRPDGSYIDVQLKGSGRTPYSRGGDGRATLGAIIREYLVSEAIAGLGIPTTRTLAMIATGETIMRDYRMAPGAIQVRTATSHLRVGSFQYAYAKLGEQGVKALADFAIEQHFPELVGRDDKYPAMLEEVARRQANLIAHWMLVGFIHGVMNTDNMSIVGESIDFGPCAFMDEFQSNKVFSSIDSEGRYAWNQQASIGYWNLQRLAETLLPLFDNDQDTAVGIAETRLNIYITAFQHAFQQGLMRKLAINDDAEAAGSFVDDTLPLLETGGMDFTRFFDALTRVAHGEEESEVVSQFSDREKGSDWLERWQQLRCNDGPSLKAMRLANPAVIARNHQVEKAIEEAVTNNDFTLFNRLARVLASPFQVEDGDKDLQAPPASEERVLRTFCGT